MRVLVALIVVLVFCLFMGVTAISMGVGAAYPPINRVAQPFVCPGGEMVSQQSVQHPLPGRTYLTASWTCVEPSGASRPIPYVSLVAGPIHGLGCFVCVAPLVLLGAFRRRGAAPPQGGPRLRP